MSPCCRSRCPIPRAFVSRGRCARPRLLQLWVPSTLRASSGGEGRGGERKGKKAVHVNITIVSTCLWGALLAALGVEGCWVMMMRVESTNCHFIWLINSKKRTISGLDARLADVDGDCLAHFMNALSLLADPAFSPRLWTQSAGSSPWAQLQQSFGTTTTLSTRGCSHARPSCDASLTEVSVEVSVEGSAD